MRKRTKPSSDGTKGMSVGTGGGKDKPVPKGKKGKRKGGRKSAIGSDLTQGFSIEKRGGKLLSGGLNEREEMVAN